MTAENLTPENNEPAGEQAPQPSAIEQKALEQGWRPKDQFQGDEADFIDAPEFVRRGELFSKIEKQSKELKVVREALEALKQHNTKVEQNAYARALKELDAQRRQAVIDGDHERSFHIEDQIELVKAEKAAVDAEAKTPVVPQTPPQLEAWMEKNSWYQTNRAMTAFADRLGSEFKARGYTLDKALQEIDAEVRKEFPDKFAAAKRPPSPEGSNRSGGASKTEVSFKPSDEERRIAKKFAQLGVMTETEYYKQLKQGRE